ncbi:MAG: helix-turn-helix transcriptional regulator [Salinivirgaceae bacterium]|jgi:DNA-binding CsgD family transcriptional regulator|nr:helix-turn-helix transcriptional regulator [Salinivirgaceae bacterium]
MIQLAVIITLVFSVVIGLYGIVLLQQLRTNYKIEYLNSFFYYQILTFLFGLYGIIGTLIIREILPKFDMKIGGIETISLFFPLIGLPFLIAGWYLQLKMVAEICNKKSSQLIGIIYFLFTTSAFLIYGFYIIKLPEFDTHLFESVRKNIFLGFGLVELIVVGYIVSFMFINAIAHKNHNSRIFLSRFALIVAFITFLKAVSLYYSGIHFSIGLYFLISYFAGSLPLIFLVKKELAATTSQIIESDTATENLIIKYKITPREKEIIIEICKGKTNQQIADSLFITLQTVKDHTHNIFQKTDVKNRVQLAQKFLGL